MREFNVGDIVVSVVDAPEDNERIHHGSTGVICRVGSGRVAVCWDDYVGGHNCDGYCTDGHGWWVNACDVKLDNETNGEPFEFDEDEFNKLVFGGEVAHGN